MFRVSPLRGLDAVAPQSNGRRVTDKSISDDAVRLSVLDGDSVPIVRETVRHDPRLEAVTAPQAVIISFGDVREERVAAERGLHPVGGRETEIVRIEHVVVRATLPGVHRV